MTIDVSRRAFLTGAAAVIAATTLPAVAPVVEQYGRSPAAAALEDMRDLRAAIVRCIERCLNPPWVVPDGWKPGPGSFNVLPDVAMGEVGAVAYPRVLPNDADWAMLDRLYERYMGLMGGKDAPMTATEVLTLNAKAQKHPG